jgi:nitric oxide reductase activation protein
MAQAELLNRVGVDFAVYAHSGDYTCEHEALDMDIYNIKQPHEPWSDITLDRLATLAPMAYNLDGHTVEYYRKICERHKAQKKIIMYYTDGEMPASNYEEELEILQREIKTCRKLGITLMGLGIRTSSPNQHGLDTVQLDDVSEVGKGIDHLSKRLLSD